MVERQIAAQWEISNPAARKVDISGNVDIGGFAIGQNGRTVTHSSRLRRRKILSQAQDDEWGAVLTSMVPPGKTRLRVPSAILRAGKPGVTGGGVVRDDGR